MRESFVSISLLTRVNVEPFIGEAKPDMKEYNSNEFVFACRAHAFDRITHCDLDGSLKCTALTTIEMNKIQLEKFGVHLNSSEGQQFIATIQLLNSPMLTLKAPNSSLNTIKKFLQTIESSYPDEYFQELSTPQTIYALLNVTSDQSSSLKITSFLADQLKMFESGSRAIVNAFACSQFERALSKTAEKKVTLNTMCQLDVWILYYLFNSNLIIYF